MIVYMVINKAKVISLPDTLGSIRMADYFATLAAAALTNHEDKVKYQFLDLGLRRMALVDMASLPNERHRFFARFQIEVDENSYNKRFELIKHLRKRPIYELRFNIREFNWRFRATFFPVERNGQLYYCFVHPFEKVPHLLDPTDSFRDDTHKIYLDTIQNPQKYHSFFK